MSIKITSDGTIYCNTIKYNWKQARNMIADGCYGNISSSEVWAGVTASTNPAGYKAYRSFKVTNAASLIQKLPKMYANRKYYFSCRYKTADSSSCSIILRNNGTDINDSNLFNYNTTNQWVFVSSLINLTTTIEKSIADVCVWVGEGTVYVSNFILIDLTDTFGAGNEPIKTWCDNNIREHEIFVNYGCSSSNVNFSNYSSIFLDANLKGFAEYNYLQLDSNWEPTEYMYMMEGDTNYFSGYVYQTNKNILASTPYYFYVEANPFNDGFTDYTQRSYFTFENESESTRLGNVIDLVDSKIYNGGGGMTNWKRISAYGTLDAALDSVNIVYYYVNRYKNTYNRITAVNLIRPESVITQYNNYNGTAITINDINKEWCDRWIDGRSSPIIHIKDPSKTEIKFNTDYDIVCNDIEIRPEIDKVVFNHNTGTIYCKKLVKTQEY